MLAQQVEIDQAVGIAFENHLAGMLITPPSPG